MGHTALKHAAVFRFVVAGSHYIGYQQGLLYRISMLLQSLYNVHSELLPGHMLQLM